MPKPDIIYKYENFSAQSLENLKAQSIYFGSPNNFNDPYDCALRAVIAEPSHEDLKALRTRYLEDPNLPKAARYDFENSDLDQFRKSIVSGAEQVIEEGKRIFLENRGVTCFSENNNDLLMWSHYGGRYKGFCSGFSTQFEPFEKIRPVIYTDKMPTINPIESLLHNQNDQYLDLFCTKASSWKYEREWRSIHNVAGTLFTYPAEALQSIYFGPDISTQCLEIICLILAGQNPNTQLWKGRRSDKEFKVEYEEFTYSSYVDSQNNRDKT